MAQDKATREDVKSAYLAWGDPLTDPAGSLGQLHFDVVMIEDHTRDTEVTEHTVEKGSAVVDHVRPNPDEITLNVFVSNTPIYSPDMSRLPLTLQLDPPGQGSFLAGGTSAVLDHALQAIGLQQGFPATITAHVDQFSGDIDYVQNTYHTLTQLRDTATLCNVITPHEFYSNMVIKRIHMHRDSNTGTSAMFELEMKEIRVVSSNITDAPIPSQPAGAPTVNKGKLDPSAAAGPLQSVAVATATKSGVALPPPAVGFPAPP